MAAQSSGGAGARRSMRDKEKAAYMKRKGIERHTANCPMCHRLVARATFKSEGSMLRHLMACKGR